MFTKKPKILKRTHKMYFPAIEKKSLLHTLTLGTHLARPPWKIVCFGKSASNCTFNGRRFVDCIFKATLIKSVI